MSSHRLDTRSITWRWRSRWESWRRISMWRCIKMLGDIWRGMRWVVMRILSTQRSVVFVLRSLRWNNKWRNCIVSMSSIPNALLTGSRASLTLSVPSVKGPSPKLHSTNSTQDSIQLRSQQDKSNNFQKKMKTKTTFLTKSRSNFSREWKVIWLKHIIRIYLLAFNKR